MPFWLFPFWFSIIHISNVCFFSYFTCVVCECIEDVFITVTKQSNVCSSDSISGGFCCKTFGCFKYRKCFQKTYKSFCTRFFFLYFLCVSPASIVYWWHNRNVTFILDNENWNCGRLMQCFLLSFFSNFRISIAFSLLYAHTHIVLGIKF